MKKAAIMIASAVVSAVLHAITLNGAYVPIETSKGPVVPGEWNASVTEGQKYAEANKVPMLAIAGSSTCAHCHAVQSACNTEEFKKWAAERKIVMAFSEAYADRTLCKPSNSNTLPFVWVYWPKSDGTVVDEKFTGTESAMPSKAGETLAGQIISSVDLYIGDWQREAGKEYLTFESNEEGARLEAETGITRYVDVPLKRDAYLKGYIGTNRVTAVCNGAPILDRVVLWNADELEMSVRIDVPEQAAAGDEIVVTLYAQDGEERGSVNIFVVEPRENSPKNPLFVGERTAATLGYGEWTMDLDVALEKYAAEPESKLLVLFGGALWCPDCVMADHFLFDREEFREWAVEKKVILVNIDIPNNPNEPSGSSCLLTRHVSKASANYRSGRGAIADESDYEEEYQSGAGYLSRHMVSEKAAEAVYARNRKLATTNWTAGGWNNPTRANQNRPGVPVLYSLTRKGELAGCLDVFSSVAPRAYDAAYLSRLEELLAMAESGETPLTDGAWQTTKLNYDGKAPTGFAGTFSAVDLTDTIALDVLGYAAAEQTIVVKGADASVAVTVSMISVVGTSETTVATASGNLAEGVGVSGTITAKETYYVVVTAKSEGALDIANPAAATSVAYALTGTREPIANPYSNAWTTTATTATLPLYSADGSALAGSMELKLTKKGKISLKVSNASKRIATLSGTWDTEISADGTATATLEKNGVKASLTITAEGVITADVSGAVAMTSGECALEADYGDFAGAYAIALPLADATGAYCGDAYMTLTMGSDKSSRTKGKMKYKVFLPDGKKLGGTTGVTGRDANFGVVPIAKTSGGNTFTAALKVRRNGGRAPSRRAVIAADGVKAAWKSGETVRECGVFGSFINKTESLVALSGVEKIAVVFDTSTIATSEQHGTFLSAVYDGGSLAVTDATIATSEKVKDFSFKLNRATGIFQGRTALSFTGKAKVSAKFSGVILPDWYSDCQCEEDGDIVVPMEFKPFGVGQCSFSDIVGGRRVKRSIPVLLE